MIETTKGRIKDIKTKWDYKVKSAKSYWKIKIFMQNHVTRNENEQFYNLYLTCTSGIYIFTNLWANPVDDKLMIFFFFFLSRLFAIEP